jgi:hypothetical protein
MLFEQLIRYTILRELTSSTLAETIFANSGKYGKYTKIIVVSFAIFLDIAELLDNF